MKPHAQIAERFARALVAGEFDAAHQFLDRDQKERVSASDLKANFESMVDYGPAYGPITDVEVMETMEEWPAMRKGDIGWAYVAISGSHYSEAVTVIIVEEDGSLRIRSIEWGRP